MDPLSNAITTMVNNELRHKRVRVISTSSKLIGHVLRVLQENGYIGEFEFVDDGGAGKFIVQLMGRVNKLSPIRPRFPVKVERLEMWERRYLPARDLGLLILSTPYGVLTNREARAQHTGGVLLAYVY